MVLPGFSGPDRNPEAPSVPDSLSPRRGASESLQSHIVVPWLYTDLDGSTLARFGTRGQSGTMQTPRIYLVYASRCSAA